MSTYFDALIAQARLALSHPERGEGLEALIELCAPADEPALQRALALLEAPDPADRSLGAHLLGQMGTAPINPLLDGWDFDDDEDDDDDDLGAYGERLKSENDDHDGSDEDDDDSDEDDDDFDEDDDDFDEDDDDFDEDDGDFDEDDDDSDEDDEIAFAHERVTALLARYAIETQPSVLSQIGQALGHLADPAAIPALCARAQHPDAGVRYGVALGLMEHDEPQALDALGALSRDADGEVRRWATLGLTLHAQRLLEQEPPARLSPQVSQALRARLHDDDLDIAAEALSALAQHEDLTILPIVIHRLDPAHPKLASTIEAAAFLAHPLLSPRLQSLQAQLRGQLTPHLREALAEALSLCDPSAADE